MINAESASGRLSDSMARPLTLPFLLAMVLLLAGCAGMPERTGSAGAPTGPAELLERATTELPEEDVLNVNIVRFDANVPSDPENAEVERVFTDVRRAESRYIPYTLRQTLQRSGQWGDVRVVPSQMPGSELEVTGRILDSHGETLSLNIAARDATGRVWLDREYSEEVHESHYSASGGQGTEPFQSLYNRIANDLLEVRRELDAGAKREIAEVAELQFAAQLAPDVYEPRLVEEEDGRVAARPGPDPLAGPIAEARRRDARMVDILDQHYSDFHSKMETPYSDWREASFREIQNLNELKRQSRLRKALGAVGLLGGIIGMVQSDGALGQLASQAAIVGGIYAVASGIDKGRQTSMHVASLRELGRSLEGDLEPMILDVKDKTVRLTGSAEVQYDQWREILGEMVDEQRDLIEQDRAERAEAEDPAR